MDRRTVLFAVASVALLAPPPALALSATIEGTVDYDYGRYSSSSNQFSVDDELDFDEALTPNVTHSFAIAAPVFDTLGASVVASFGPGWLRLHGTAAVAIGATPDGTEAGGRSSFEFYARVFDSVTIDAFGLTGTTGTARVGFWADGGLSAGRDASEPFSSAGACGVANAGATLTGNDVVSESLDGLVDNAGACLVIGAPPAITFSDTFLGGVLNFTYGTPIDVEVYFVTEGAARAASDYDDGLPAAATMVADFGRTFTWAGVSDLRDAAGAPVVDFTALSSTGADFRYAIPAPEVAEPASRLLAFTVLGWLSARAQQRARLSGAGRAARPRRIGFA